MLKQHRNAAQPAMLERLRERTRHYHVARLIDFAEQAGISLNNTVTRKRDARRG
jgi:hypothetical protein